MVPRGRLRQVATEEDTTKSEVNAKESHETRIISGTMSLPGLWTSNSESKLNSQRPVWTSEVKHVELGKIKHIEPGKIQK